MPPPRPKVPPYLLMLVVSFALVGLIGYQTLKDRKISGDLLLENTALKELLKEERKKANEFQKEFSKVTTQREELNGLKEGLSGQLIELGRVKSLTEAGKKKLESSLAEKEIEIKDLKARLALLHKKEEELKLMKKEIVQKDAEISDLKARMKEVGKDSSERLDTESVNPSESAVKGDEEKREKKELREEDETSSGKGFGAEREKEPSDGDEETEAAKASDEHSGEHAKVSKKKAPVQIVDNEDEESKVDDREETLSNDEEIDADKTHDDEETEKIHEEEETDEQPDVDMDGVIKADLEENEITAME